MALLKRIFAPSGFKIALLMTLVTLALFLYYTLLSSSGGFITLLDNRWVDFIVKSRDRQPHTHQVAIATIDTKSVDAYGRWPWSRERMAELVRTLKNHYDAGVIGFDVLFSEPEESSGFHRTKAYQQRLHELNLDTSPKGKAFANYLETNLNSLNADAQLAQAIREAGNVVLGYFFITNMREADSIPEATNNALGQLLNGSEVHVMRGRIAQSAPIGLVPEPNIPLLSQDTGALSGFFNMIPDSEDGTVRRVHLVFAYRGIYYPSLALQILARYYNAASIEVYSDELGIYQIALGSERRITPQFDGSLQLNFRGPQETFPHYSIYDIIEKTVPKEDLANKIVLIGATEVGIYDLRNTPVGVSYPGVEVHATLIDNIISGTYFYQTDANLGYTFFLILAFGLGLGILLPRLRSFYGSLLALGALLAYLALHRYLVNHVLTWPSAMYIVLVTMLVWGSVTLYQFLVTDKDKRFINTAFAHYLSPEVIHELTKNPDFLRLGGDRRELTAFFSDVQGFSSISESLAPEALVSLLNAYLTEMSDIILANGGTVDKYEGDAIIAFVGAPVAYPDHAYRSCKMAVEMQERLAELRTLWLAEGKPEILQRIGINTGTMVVGNMGSQRRFDYTMMGHAVNLAARLEGANKVYGTYTCISEYTHAHVHDQFETRELDLIQVVGIQHPVHIHELLSKKGALNPTHRQALDRFEEGLLAYRSREWPRARAIFESVLEDIPNDPPSKTYLERCQTMETTPPPPNWNGVYIAQSK